MTVFPAYLCRLNAGFCPLGHSPRGLQEAPPQVHSSRLAVPRVVLNMHVWAGFMAGFHSTVREPSSGQPSPRSLQHDVFEVLLQDGVLDSVKDKTDIFRVYGGGEVVEEWLAPVSPLTAEGLHEESLRRERGGADGGGVGISRMKQYLYERVFQQH